jgi:hypothetical protein
MGWRKTQGNWVVEIDGQMSRIEDAGDFCLRRPRLTQGCRASGGGGGDISLLKVFSLTGAVALH